MFDCRRILLSEDVALAEEAPLFFKVFLKHVLNTTPAPSEELSIVSAFIPCSILTHWVAHPWQYRNESQKEAHIHLFFGKVEKISMFQMVAGFFNALCMNG